METPPQWVDHQCLPCACIAVIVDVVYNHMSGRTLLRNFGGFSFGGYANGIYFNDAAHGVSPWGPRPDFQPAARSQRILEDNALMLMTQLGADGQRWDSVANTGAYSGGRGANTPIGWHQADAKIHGRLSRDAAGQDPHREDLRNDAIVTKPTAQGGSASTPNGTTHLRSRAPRHHRRRHQPKLGRPRAGHRSQDRDDHSPASSTRDHDQVGHPPRGNPRCRRSSIHRSAEPQAKQLSTLAAAIILTSPGVPMLFQARKCSTRALSRSASTFRWIGAACNPGGHDPDVSGQDRLAATSRQNGRLSGGNVKVSISTRPNHTLGYRRWDKGAQETSDRGDQSFTSSDF